MKGEKRIYDSLHGFIHLNAWESFVVGRRPFQRLHYIRQLGCAYLVYPGAVHTRFEHSLGTMELAGQIFDVVAKQLEQAEDLAYWRQMVRLGALMHDLGHLPFSHSAERALLGPDGHEAWTLKVLQSAAFTPLWNDLQAAFPGHPPKDAITKIALGPQKCPAPFSDFELIMSEIVTGDFFGADRIDYLLRDAKYTGLSYGLLDYQQLIATIVPIDGKSLGIEEGGLESCEALLLARHFMFRRIYNYPSIKSYGFHLSRFMASIWNPTNLDEYLAYTDNEILAALMKSPYAKPFFDRSARFQAYPLTPKDTEETLRTFQKKHKIPPEEIFWEFLPQKRGERGLNFTCKQKNGDTVPAASISSMRIPEPPCGWLYLAPGHGFS